MFNLLSANAFNLVTSKFCSLENGSQEKYLKSQTCWKIEGILRKGEASNHAAFHLSQNAFSWG